MDNLIHSVNLIEEKCRGCTKCMVNCPVEAVRLKNSRAVIYADRCIDCGECIRVCPYNAHVAQNSKLDSFTGYRIKVAIPSISLYSQFGGYVDPNLINEALESLGFDEVFDMTYACDIVSEIIKMEIKDTPKPAISSLCPAIVRLIQTSYPELLEHVVRVLTPMEVSASLAREKYIDRGFRHEEVGVFYLTPCVARIIKSKHTPFNDNTEINGSIAISDIYPEILKYIGRIPQARYRDKINMSYSGLSWSITGGQSRTLGINEFISVDGVENVIKLLNDLEKGKFRDVEFIEAFACTEGCVGGILLVDNPFNASRVVKKYQGNLRESSACEGAGEKYKGQFTTSFNKKSNHRFADDFAGAVKKMNEMNRLINRLPGIDCGQCGSPSCKAFAEDVVRGLASVKECKMIKF